MATDRLSALLVADDSATPLRLEVDQNLYLCLNHLASPTFAGLVRASLRLYKADAGDGRSIQFRIGEPDANDTSDASSLEFYVHHNTGDELEIFAWNGGAPAGIKIDQAGNVEITGDLTFSGTIPNPLPGYPTILTGTLTHDPPSIAATDDFDFNITVTGALLANTPAVAVSPSGSLPQGIIIPFARVSADNTVLVRYRNATGSSINMGSHTVRAVVFQY